MSLFSELSRFLQSKWVARGIALLCVGAFIAWFGRAFWEGEEDPDLQAFRAQQVALGEGVFQIHCESCHGKKAIGQDPTKPFGGNNITGEFLAPAMNGSGHSWRHTPAALLEIIKNGSQVPNSPMRGFAGKLTELEMLSAMYYTRSLWPLPIKNLYAKGIGQALCNGGFSETKPDSWDTTQTLTR